MIEEIERLIERYENTTDPDEQCALGVLHALAGTMRDIDDTGLLELVNAARGVSLVSLQRIRAVRQSILARQN